MISIFIAPKENNRPKNLPPFEAEGSPQLYYTEDGILKGGYSIFLMPDTPEGYCFVRLNAPEATITDRKNDAEWLWLEDIEEVEDDI